MSNYFNLSAEKIYNKDFSIDFKGYSPKEIDEFLDEVIQDYQAGEKITSDLLEENRKLKYEIATLKAEIIELKANINVNNNNTDNSNIDILRRLSRLEEIILNK